MQSNAVSKIVKSEVSAIKLVGMVWWTLVIYGYQLSIIIERWALSSYGDKEAGWVNMTWMMVGSFSFFHGWRQARIFCTITVSVVIGYEVRSGPANYLRSTALTIPITLTIITVTDLTCLYGYGTGGILPPRIHRKKKGWLLELVSLTVAAWSTGLTVYSGRSKSTMSASRISNDIKDPQKNIGEPSSLEPWYQ